MPARSTLGDQSAAVPLSAITCWKPKAAALRNTEPTLPASCSRSSTTVGASGSTTGRSGSSSRKPIGAGDSSPLAAFSSSSSTTTVLPASRDHSTGACGQNDSENTATAGVTPRASAARHRWSPSSQMRPSLR